MARNNLLSEYNDISRSCELILNSLNYDSTEETMGKLKTCRQSIDKLIKDPSNNHVNTVLSCIQRQLKIQHRDVQNMVEQKANKNPKPALNVYGSSEQVSDTIKSTLEGCQVEVTGQGFKTLVGLYGVKGALTSSVILPLTQPQLFDGLKLRNCILLYGPPGTGKTKLAMATAAEANAQLISVTSSSILSSYFGESEKKISNIFDFVRSSKTPTILFIDEIDALCRVRSENEPDHTRRVKTELLCQISKFSDISNGYLLCATNCPWELDIAFTRRFQRQLYVPLPGDMDRYNLIKFYSKGTSLENAEEAIVDVVRRTPAYSSSDIEHLIMQALIKPIERLQYVKIWKELDNGTYEPLYEVTDITAQKLHVCNMKDLPGKSVKRPDVESDDLLRALEESFPTVSPDLVKKFENYQK